MPLEPGDAAALCAIARDSVAAAIANKSFIPVQPAGGPVLREQRGCFVTLKTGGRLRGCIGCFSSSDPLYRTVAEYARLSATADPRFVGSRLRTVDLPGVDIEISVLSPLEPCREPRSITLGKHGIYVRHGGRSGCFLPQVAEETGWTLEEFWGHCCRDKAGLTWDAWLSPDIELQTFTAEVIGCG